MGRQGVGGIAWTDMTWNPVRGCSRISPGCGGPGPHGGCYAEVQALRIYRMDRGRGVPIGEGSYDGLVTMVGGRDCDTCAGAGRGPVQHEFGEWCPTCFGLGRIGGEARWTGAVRLVPHALDAPLRMREPQRIFVNSMSDLFHESLSDDDIDRAFAVMALAHWHTFQVLTKRVERMRAYVNDPETPERIRQALNRRAVEQNGADGPMFSGVDWPLPNAWLGVSAEDQQRVAERIPYLLATLAAVRFVSFEPLLGPIDARPFLRAPGAAHGGIDWAIIGGESGPHARPCDVAWIRSIYDQCYEAGIACFVKQLGAHVIARGVEDLGPADLAAWDAQRAGEPFPSGGVRLPLRDSHGGDPAEWPEDLRVRELPA